MSEEKRIYVAIAAEVNIDGRVVKMEPGRQAVQGGHAKSMVHQELFLKLDLWNCIPTYEPRTTIYKSCRDSYELSHIARLLGRVDPLPIVEMFTDTNKDFYGVDWGIPTAIAAYLTSEEAIGVFDYLPLWSGK